MSASLLERCIEVAGSPEAFLSTLSPPQTIALSRCWEAWGRPEQLPPPGDWMTWLVLAGRGYGKSRTGAEFIRGRAMKYPGCHIALIARTASEVRSIIVKALTTAWKGGKLDPASIPNHSPSTRTLEWPNGSYATTYSADEPKQLLGQNFDFFWADELAAWPTTLSGRKETGQRSVMEEVWHEGLMFALRGSGCNIDRPCGIATTTPRPKKLIRDLVKKSLAENPSTVVTRGSTYDNAKNLSPEYIDKVREEYDGSRLGRQEIYAEMLEDTPGALWTLANIDELRVDKPGAPDMARVIVAVDPSGGHGDANDEQGIVVTGRGVDGRGYVIEDQSCKLTPDGWGRRAVQAYIDNQADLIVYENNFGGEMCEHVLQTAARMMSTIVNTKEVKASRGKVARAEPVAALYEQKKVSHVGTFLQMEEEMCRFVPGGLDKSPNRADALVWGLTELMLEPISSLDLWMQIGL